MKLYFVQIDIREAATNYAYPVVRHTMYGKTKQEAWGYVQSHMKSDAFLSQCAQKGTFQGTVTCRVEYSEGWV